ncbi:DUF2079 domain-containing protein [Micromonosporaceae bacterium DT55]|uniref:DUF2079 domain-containing protein n=1 Tax=Melissospora conviva TaxID=3388432 RepID=UPI003C14646D
MPKSPSRSSEPPPERAGTRRLPHWRSDLFTVLAAFGLAFLVTAGLWLDPNGRAITVNSSDQALFEWLLSYGAHAVTHGENPLYTTLLNYPLGVNLAVNTSITVYAVVFAPLTFLAGAPMTFLVILTLNLAATAIAWYWLLSRHLVGNGFAAALGGLFIGFAPGMVSHANAHLNWTAGWLVPLLIWRVIQLRQPGRWLRNGLILGVLVAIAFSIAAEGLFFTALALAVFLAVWAAQPPHWGQVRAALPSFLRGLGVTAVTAGALLAYPLWLHFAGPQRFHGTGFDAIVHSEDLAAYGAYPQRSLAGLAGLDTGLAPNPTEENSFFGIPLLLLAVVCFVLLFRYGNRSRRATLIALAVTAIVFTVLSLGPVLKFNGSVTDTALPFATLGRLPVINAALPSRLALIIGPILGILLAYAADLLIRRRRGARSRAIWIVAFAVALVPLIPAPLLTLQREPIPQFITAGTWREYVSPGGVLTPLPLTLDVTPDGQRWQAYALADNQGEFAIPSGFFLGPGGPDGRGKIGPVVRTFDSMVARAGQTGRVPPVTRATRVAALQDLEYWDVQVVVLADAPHGAKWPVRADAVRQVATELLGEPTRVDDVWLWTKPANGWVG